MLNPDIKEMPTSKEDEAIHKALFDTNKRLASLTRVRPEVLMSVYMELLIKYSKECWGIVEDQYEYETYLKKWFESYLQIRYGKEMDQWKQSDPENVVEVVCTLCGDKMHKPRVSPYMNINTKIHRMEVEGCTHCYKGIGEPINSVTWYDKDNKVIYHAKNQDIKGQTLADVQKVMDGL